MADVAISNIIRTSHDYRLSLNGGMLMPNIIQGNTYYRTKEACAIIGIGRATLFRWIKSGLVVEPSYRDRRGWRLFTEEDIEVIKEEHNRISSFMP